MASNFPRPTCRQEKRHAKYSARKKQNNILENNNNRTCESTFPRLDNPRAVVELKLKYSSGIESCTEETEVPLQPSRFRLLPPIESATKVTKAKRQKSPDIRRKDTVDNKISFEALIATKPSNDNVEKPNALPPILSSDGVPDKINKLLQQNLMGKRQEEIQKREPRKRAKTHTIYKEIRRGDSWELLKAEKIRCVELDKYQEKMAHERKQQMKIHKKKNRVPEKTKRSRVAAKRRGQQADDIEDLESEDCY